MQRVPLPSTLLLGLSVILAMTVSLLVIRHVPTNAASGAILGRSDLLAAIPAPNGKSASDREIRRWMEKARRSAADDKAWAGLGDALMQRVRETGDQAYYGHAESADGRSLQINPRNLGALTGLAWVYGGRHAFDNSVEWAEKAIAIDPKNNIAYGLNGDAEVERGEYD